MTHLKAEALADPKAYTKPDEVYELLAHLRKNDPVTFVEPEGYRPFWAVSRYEYIQFIETNPEIFSSVPRTFLWPIAAEQLNLEKFGNVNGTSMLPNMDGDNHRAHRMLAQKWFMPRALHKLEGFVNDTAKKYVDQMEDMNGECDFAKDVAWWYPLRIAMTLLGVPEEDDKHIQDLAKRVFNYESPEFTSDGTKPEEVLAGALQGYADYLAPMAEDRMKNPQDDLVTTLINATVNGEKLGPHELISFFILLGTAGHDTTAHVVAGGLLRLIENPEQLKKLLENPDLIANAADEMIRHVAPTKQFLRVTTQDVEIGGKMIKKGESVMVLFASACRDDSVFENPNDFDIERKNANKHMAFGYGAHHCIGKQLARMEVAAFFRELLSRFNSFELVEPATHQLGILVVGTESVKIRFKKKA